MPETISKYRVFLASPSDLSGEREAVNEVISELNLTYGSLNNIMIELVRWETYSGPGVSTSNVQQIINQDIGQYDVFIGLLWKKFGSKTLLYDSGTEEEFNIAYAKYLDEPNSLQILFYFKMSPVNLEDIDPDQLKKVKAFKASLGEKNILYWEFDPLEDLKRYLRIHIPKRIDDLKKASVHQNLLVLGQELLESEVVDEEELGTMDYIDIFEDSMADSAKSLAKISDATSEVAEQFTKKAEQLNTLVKNNHNQKVSSKTLRNIYIETAEIMNNYAGVLKPEKLRYIEKFEESIDAFSKLMMIYKTDFDGYEDEIESSKASLVFLLTQIDGGIESLEGFRNTVRVMPRVSKEMNKARNNVDNELSDFILKLNNSNSLANEVLKNLGE